MVPVLELRGSLPFAYANGLNMWLSILISVAGNLLPVPFVIIYMRRIFNYIRVHFPKFNGIINKLESRTEKKSKAVLKYAFFGMFLLVAIPLPGTGAWIGSLIANFLHEPLKKAWFPLVLGVLTAGSIILIATGSVVTIFEHVN